MTYIGSRRFPRFSAHIKWLIWEWTFNLAIPSPAWVRKLCILNNLNFFTPNVLNWLITIVQGLIRSVTHKCREYEKILTTFSSLPIYKLTRISISYKFVRWNDDYLLKFFRLFSWQILGIDSLDLPYVFSYEIKFSIGWATMLPNRVNFS